MDSLAYIVLAAGMSRRFGGTKQLAKIGTKLLINYTIEKLPANSEDTFVVLGAKSDDVKNSITPKCNLLINEQWQEGIASSIRTAISQIGSNYSHVLICLADQVALRSDDYKKLESKARELPENIICARYANLLGVPAIFPNKYYDELCSLKGDTGARRLLNNNKDIVPIDIPEAATDIDTQVQLEEWLELNQYK